MTKEIQKAIDFIHAYMHPVDDSESEKRKLKYRDMAIRSLEAWEKVREDIKNGVYELDERGYYTYAQGLHSSLGFIDNHLSEVEVSE